ncbi:PLD nuclease N-terminal domain-containing protein [Streptomyces sp. NPDC054961]
MTLAATGENAVGIAAVVIVVAVGVAYAVLFIGALVSIARSGLTGAMKLAWAAFAVVAPFLGSVIWFLIGRRDAQRQPRTV